MSYLKQSIYISAFVLLGLLIATLIHAVVELIALAIIFGNPEQFAETMWWQEWELIHGIFAGGLWFVGFAGGVYGGVKYWDIIYVKKQRHKTVRSM